MSDAADIPEAELTPDPQAEPLYPMARIVTLEAREAAALQEQLQADQAALAEQQRTWLANAEAQAKVQVEQAAEVAARRATDEIAERFRPLIGQLQSVSEGVAAEVQQAAFVVAEAILHTELSVRPERVRELLADVMARENEPALRIICGTASHARLQPHWPDFVAGLDQPTPPALALDPDADAESLVVETPLGRHLAGLPDQLRALRERLAREDD